MHDVGYTFEAYVLWERNLITSDAEVVKVSVTCQMSVYFMMLKGA